MRVHALRTQSEAKAGVCACAPRNVARAAVRAKGVTLNALRCSTAIEAALCGCATVTVVERRSK